MLPTHRGRADLVCIASPSFRRVKKDTAEMEIVRSVFQTMIAPIYGTVTESLKKIEKSEDRSCELMYVNETPVALTIYKNERSRDYAHLGIQECFELKTLLLLDPTKDSGRGHGSTILKRVELIAAQEYDTIAVTVATGKKDALHFFRKHGFNPVCCYQNEKYPLAHEWLLVKRVAHRQLPKSLTPKKQILVTQKTGKIHKKQFIDCQSLAFFFIISTPDNNSATTKRGLLFA